MNFNYEIDREAENNPSPARPKGSSRAYNAGLIPEFIQKKKKRP